MLARHSDPESLCTVPPARAIVFPICRVVGAKEPWVTFVICDRVDGPRRAFFAKVSASSPFHSLQRHGTIPAANHSVSRFFASAIDPRASTVSARQPAARSSRLC